METILNKELTLLRRENGELWIASTEAQQNLDSLHNECNNLRAENLKLKGQLTEINILKKQNLDLSGDVNRLESVKAVIEGEVREMKKEYVKLEELYKKEKNLVKKVMDEKERIRIKHDKLQNRYDTVMNAATGRYKGMDDRLKSLEEVVVVMKQNFQSSDSQEEDATEILDNENESFEFGSKDQFKVATTQTPTNEASSRPSLKAIDTTCVEGLPETSNSNTRSAGQTIKLSSSLPYAHTSSSASPFIDLCLSDDDDGSRPSSKGLKRKLPSVEDSSKII